MAGSPFLPQPPRMGRDQQSDQRALIDWTWKFFQALAVDNEVLVRATEYADPGVFDAANLPTPTGTTVAQAQLTANNAYLLAALLAASILPLSTAYSVGEVMGSEASVDDRYEDARLFYLSYLAVVVVGAGVVLVPGIPLISLLVATQVLNAVLLLPLLGFLYVVAGDAELMGEQVSTPRARAGYLVAIGLIGLCVAALLVLSVA